MRALMLADYTSCLVTCQLMATCHTLHMLVRSEQVT